MYGINSFLCIAKIGFKLSSAGNLTNRFRTVILNTISFVMNSKFNATVSEEQNTTKK